MQKVKQLAIWQLGWVFSEFLGKVVMGQSQEFWDLGFQASQRPEKGQKMQYPGCTYHQQFLDTNKNTLWVKV